MQRLLLPILALLALTGSALLAQNITGTWQGTLKVNGTSGSVDLRTVMKISRVTTKASRRVLQHRSRPAPVAMTSITLKGTAVKVSLVQLNGTFDGTLSGDGNTIGGKWTQGGRALPLNLVRATDQTAWTIPEPPPAPMMSTSAKPEFTVATIKPSRPDAPRGGYGFRARM